ncbi:aldo/keto reductase [Streptomyces sp. NPDC052107]|uniref:aldo/keto reductase n=1 Tax=Streptomyces sp. NPDC052107 TaxID=3155632 RepID=UPI0034337861
MPYREDRGRPCCTFGPRRSSTWGALVAPEVLRRAREIAAVCEAHGVTLPQAAMAFPLLHPAVAGIVVGMRSPKEVRDNIAAFQANVPDQVWADLVAADLLDERAPVHA